MTLYTSEFGEARDDVTVTDPDERPGWYVTVNEGLDVFASGPGERSTNGEPGGETWRCTSCGETVTYKPDDPEECNDDPDHTWEPIPLSWANSAHITFDDADDAIHVSVSVGDPRGRFVFTVRRWRNDEGEDALLIHTPYPGEGMPHMPLTEIRPGTYQVGH